jgi:hypothetical protein
MTRGSPPRPVRDSSRPTHFPIVRGSVMGGTDHQRRVDQILTLEMA